MRIAAISDIHGNLTALETVLDDLNSVGEVDLIWVLGDLAALGPRPAECIQKLIELREKHGKDKVKIIGGNTDRYMVTGERFPTPPAEDEAAFDTLAERWTVRDAILNWNQVRIDWEEYEFLKSILGKEVAKTIEGYGTVIGYHAIPGDDESMALRPDTSDEEANDALLDREGRLAVGGHTHLQMDRTLKDWRVINIGSVGLSFSQPGIAEWALLTFEDGDVTVDLRSIPYSVEALKADLDAVGYPEPKWLLSLITPKNES